jgi:hypothetical protein
MQHPASVASAAALSILFGSTLAQADDSGFELERGTKVLRPIQFKQLAIFPVVTDKRSEDATRYLTLAEGLEQKKVLVTEAKEGARVNQVAIENQSDHPLLLLGGELILGGQQDRVISKDSVIAPHQQASLEVYCVEHGRWQGRHEFESGGAIADSKIRLRAKHRSDQGQVWQAVAEENVAFSAAPPTGTYRNIATGSEGAKAVQPYRDAIASSLAKLPQFKQMVGIIAAVNGRVVSLDVFSTPELFASHRDRLLDSIFVSAASAPVTKTGEKAPSVDEIKSFVKEADKAPAKVILDAAQSRTLQRHTKDVVSSTVESKAGGKLGRAIYKSYQANE